MIAAARKYAFGSAMINFNLVVREGVPGDMPAAMLGGALGGAFDDDTDGQNGGKVYNEDIPGVPMEAWVRVQRGVPPLDPYTPGEGAHGAS